MLVIEFNPAHKGGNVPTPGILHICLLALVIEHFIFIIVKETLRSAQLGGLVIWETHKDHSFIPAGDMSPFSD